MIAYTVGKVKKENKCRINNIEVVKGKRKNTDILFVAINSIFYRVMQKVIQNSYAMLFFFFREYIHIQCEKKFRQTSIS